MKIFLDMGPNEGVSTAGQRAYCVRFVPPPCQLSVHADRRVAMR